MSLFEKKHTASRFAQWSAILCALAVLPCAGLAAEVDNTKEDNGSTITIRIDNALDPEGYAAIEKVLQEALDSAGVSSETASQIMKRIQQECQKIDVQKSKKIDESSKDKKNEVDVEVETHILNKEEAEKIQTDIAKTVEHAHAEALKAHEEALKAHEEAVGEHEKMHMLMKLPNIDCHEWVFPSQEEIIQWSKEQADWANDLQKKIVDGKCALEQKESILKKRIESAKAAIAEVKTAIKEGKMTLEEGLDEIASCLEGSIEEPIMPKKVKSDKTEEEKKFNVHQEIRVYTTNEDGTVSEWKLVK